MRKSEVGTERHEAVKGLTSIVWNGCCASCSKALASYNCVVSRSRCRLAVISHSRPHSKLDAAPEAE